MSSYQATIRDGVYTKIYNGKSGFVITTFDVEKTYYPTSNLEDLSTQPQVKVTAMGMGSERERTLRNVAVKKLDLGVMVHVQQKVNPTDLATIDKLVNLVEQIMNTCEDDELVTGADFQWIGTEPLKDENDIIYSYEALTVSGVFQAVFILHYTYIL